MTINHRLNRIFMVAGCLLLATSPASAGKITGVTTFGSEDGTGPGLGNVLVAGIVHVTDNNDNQTGGGSDDNNISVPVKKFKHNGYIDIEFHVANTGGISEYSIVEFIDNDVVPFASWSKFEMYLGFGVDADFEVSPAGDGLDFDYDDFDIAPSSTAFSLVAMGEDKLEYYNGSHFTGAQEYTLRIDVPDNLPNGRFTLRQVPIVPEPSTFLLTVLAVIGGCAVLRRRVN